MRQRKHGRAEGLAQVQASKHAYIQLLPTPPITTGLVDWIPDGSKSIERWTWTYLVSSPETLRWVWDAGRRIKIRRARSHTLGREPLLGRNCATAWDEGALVVEKFTYEKRPQEISMLWLVRVWIILQFLWCCAEDTRSVATAIVKNVKQQFTHKINHDPRVSGQST